MVKLIKVLVIISMVISLCIIPLTYVQASSAQSTIEDITVTEPDSDTTTGLTGMAGRILGILQIASAIAAVILIAVFGFKFILGSAEEKSDYMKSFIPLIVGVVVVFAASSIASLIFNIAGA